MKKGFKITLFSLGLTVLILSVVVILLIRNANRIIKYELEEILGKDFSVKEIRLTWGEVEALDVSFKNPAGRQIFKTDSLNLNADFTGLLKKEYVISRMSLVNPYVFFEVDKKGNLVTSLPKKQPKTGEKPGTPFLFKKIEIKKGALDYLDGKVSKTPILTKLRNIDLEVEDITLPLSERFSPFTVTATIPGNISTGILKSKGKIKLKTWDTDCRVTLSNLDITGFKPYFQKKGDVNVTKGFLDLDMNMRIASKKIHAPGRAVLRDLKFEQGNGSGEKFINIPRAAVVSFMKNNKNEIVFDFTLEGDLANPKFNLRQSFMEKLTLGIAEKLGLSVTKIGESIVILGAEGVKDIGEGIKDIFK